MQHFWHIMLYYFRKGKNATETPKTICVVYGEGVVTDWTCQKWFAKFYAGDFSLDHAPWSGRSVEVDSDQIKTLFKNNQSLHHVGDSQHTQNIQINKVIGENKKCVFYFMENTKWTFWPTEYFLKDDFRNFIILVLCIKM